MLCGACSATAAAFPPILLPAREAAKVASAEATERTGILHDFQPVDLRDPSVAPDSDDGLQSQHDRAVAEGRKESKGTFVHTVT